MRKRKPPSNKLTIRNKKIVHLFATGETHKQIANRFGISASRVGQIIYSNSHLLEVNKAVHKQNRINILQRKLKEYEFRELKNKDVIDILRELRAETEGDKNTQQIINVVKMPTVEINGNPLELNIGEEPDGISYSR